MGTLRGRVKQLRAWVKRDQVEAELDEELRFHIEMETEKNIREGMAPAAARRAALVAFRGVDRTKEEVRSARWTRAPEELAGDVRFALRALARKPGLAAAIVLTLGLGIGATTAIFGVVDALFLRHPAGVAGAEDVVRLYMVRDEGMVKTPSGGPGSYVDYESVRRGVAGFSDVTAAFPSRELDLGRGEEAARIRGRSVAIGYLSFLGVRPEAGRFFLPAEDSAGSQAVAVISHGFWQRHFGGAQDVIGRTLELDGTARTVVGVVERGFVGIEPDPVEVWVPLAAGSWREMAPMAGVTILGRLRAEATREAVVTDAEKALAHAAEAEPGLDQTPGVLLGTLVPAGGPNRPPAANLALWLLVMAGMVLVIACSNVANMLLARATSRRRETAVRLSLGAGRARVVRQYLVESLVLSVIGGTAGVGLALWGASVARQFPLPPAAGNVDGRTLLFAVSLALATGLLFGLAPALRAAGTDPAAGLKENASAQRPSRGRVRRGLVALQVALSAVLLVGASLFVQSLTRVHAVDPGFDAGSLLVVSAELQTAGYGPPEQEAFYNEAIARLSGMAGVEGAAMTHFPPFSSSSFGVDVEVVGNGARPTASTTVNWVGPGYFSTLGTDVVRGRPIERGDGSGTEPVAVVNESLARQLEASGSVVGLCLNVRVGVWEDACTRVVGVAEDQRSRYLTDGPVAIYLAREQDPAPISWGGPALVVRISGPAAALTGSVRTALQALRPDLPFVAVEPVSEIIRPEILPYRLGATLFSLFGILAAILASVGLYGVLGYFVAERRSELGIRRALGATQGHALRLVIRQGILPVAAGLLVGLTAAFAGGRLIEALLFGVDARDPLAFALVPMLLLAVGLLASYLPGRRAARVEPMVALRTE